MQLTIVKTGKFAAQFQGDASRKCDLAKVAVYTYEVRIDATDEHLSPEGFIIENSRIQGYFEAKYSKPQPALSCELIAQTAARDLGALLQAEHISVLAVTCTITGSNGALLSAKWQA